ncbi:MAG: outer membrane beta-barrel protein [Muribaculaceae bacterium]|nr:outer membrane beta-barrel protein [Muribaculaceae bacterium]
MLSYFYNNSRLERIIAASLLLLYPCLVNALTSTRTDTIPENRYNEERVDSLRELVVTQSTISHDGLNDTYLVTKAMRQNARNAADLLGKIAGVHYNPLTAELSYLGSKKVKILVDSLEKDDEYIKRLNPNRFARITVVSIPGGKYAGYDALINLVTKKTYQGYDGTILAETAFRTGDRNGKGHQLNSWRGLGEFTFTKDKINLALSASYTGLDNGLRASFNTTYPLNSYSTYTPMPAIKDPNSYVRKNNANIRLWADFRIARNHTLSVGIGLDPAKEKQGSRYKLFAGDAESMTDKGIQTTSTDIDSYLAERISLQYIGRAREWQLNASAGFSNTSYNSTYSLRRPEFDILEPTKYHASYEWAGMDASRRMIDSKLYLSLSEYAIRVSFSEKDRSLGKLLTKSSDFRNRAEALLQFTPSPKWSFGVKAGLNIEHSRRQDISATYVTPRLNANLNFSSSKVWLRLNYTVSNQNPTLTQTRDYGSFTDSLVMSAGNPLLHPAINHRINLNAGFPFNISLGAEYTIRHNGLFEIVAARYESRPDGVYGPYAFITYMNGHGQTWKTNISWQKTIAKRWTISLSATLRGESARFEEYSNSGCRPEYSWFIQYFSHKAALQFYLSSSLHSSMTVTPQEAGWGQYDGYSLSAVKFFCGYRLQIVGMWTLPLHLIRKPFVRHLRSEAMLSTTTYDNINLDDNALRLTLVYRFNGGRKTRNYSRQEESVDIR